jgi:predicted acyltransferase
LIVPGATGQRFDLTPVGNVGAVIDRWVFGVHTWQPKWDPEGLLSTIPAIGTTLVGLLTGLWLRATASEPRRLLKGLVYGGLIVTMIGAVWSLQFPLVKNIWTSSYALFTAGLGVLSLAACYWLIDVRGSRWWTTPFVVLGMNAITLFVVSGLLTKITIYWKVMGAFGKPIAWRTWFYREYFASWASPLHASLLYAVANLVVLYGLLWWMHRRGVFLKV